MRKPFIASFALAVLLFLGSIISGNWEFVIYGVIAILATSLLYWTDHKFHYESLPLWGFAAWIVLHTLGGLAEFGGVRLYDFIFIELVGEPYNILKYDQVVHFYTYVVIGALLCSVVDSIVSAKAEHWVISTVVILAAIGVGAINEIIEFLPVVLFNAPGPGGYINTALDLVMNSLGAIVGTWLHYHFS